VGTGGDGDRLCGFNVGMEICHVGIGRDGCEMKCVGMGMIHVACTKLYFGQFNSVMSPQSALKR